MLCLVRHVRPEIAPHNAVPRWVVLFIELFLDEGGDVLLDVEFLEGLRQYRGEQMTLADFLFH